MLPQRYAALGNSDRDRARTPSTKHYLLGVRPVTSIAVAILLGVIVLAFVFKLATGGLTP